MDLGDVVWHFDRSGGDEAAIRELVSGWADEPSRPDLHRALWCVRLSRVTSDEDLGRLLSQSLEGLSSEDAVRLCREFYVDLCTSGGRAPWSVFADLGFAARDLALSFPGCSAVLGSTVQGDDDRQEIQLTDVIGVGNFGVVFAGMNISSGGRVAIKWPRGASAIERTQSASLLQNEADCLRVAGGYGFPGYIDTVTLPDGTVALVTELISGKTIAEHQDGGQIRADLAYRWCAELAEIVDLLHLNGIYHRDLKPENVIITDSGAVCLLDLGLAIPNRNCSLEKRIVVGTLGYMAPESVAGQGGYLDHRADIWSIGAILYELTIGKRNAPLALLSKSLGNKGRLDATEPFGEAPPAVRSILNCCLRSEIELRYERAKDLAHDLRSLLRGDSSANDHDRLALQGWRLGGLIGRCRELAKQIKLSLGSARVIAMMSDVLAKMNRPGLEAKPESYLARAKDNSRSLAHMTQNLAACAQAVIQMQGLPPMPIDDEVWNVLRGQEAEFGEEEWLRSHAKHVREYLELMWRSILDAFRQRSDRATACLELGMATWPPIKCVQSLNAIEPLRVRAHLDARAWNEYLRQVATDPDSKQACFHWSRSVEQELLFGDDDYSEYDAFDPFRTPNSTFKGIVERRQEQREDRIRRRI